MGNPVHNNKVRRIRRAYQSGSHVHIEALGRGIKMDTTLTEPQRSFLREAINLAKEAEQHGNLPIGAVLILDGKIVATGMNSIWKPTLNLTCHAEMETLRS